MTTPQKKIPPQTPRPLKNISQQLTETSSQQAPHMATDAPSLGPVEAASAQSAAAQIASETPVLPTGQQLAEKFELQEAPAINFETSQAIDRWGRSFDPSIHVHKKGVPSLYRGRSLILQPGKEPPSGPVAAKRPVEQAPLELNRPEAIEETSSDILADIEESVVSEAEKKRRAKIYANLNRKIWKLAGRIIAGSHSEMTEEEAKDIYDSAFEDSYLTGREMWFGYWVVNVIEGAQYLLRIGDAASERVKKVWGWIKRKGTWLRDFIFGKPQDPPSQANP